MAHTGVALSEAEASMVSPFTSKIKSVSLAGVTSAVSSFVSCLRGAESSRKRKRTHSTFCLFKNHQVAAVEELLREGRAALHTSIASYKFLITYGLLFSVLKLACYYYGVIMCQVRSNKREIKGERSHSAGDEQRATEWA